MSWHVGERSRPLLVRPIAPFRLDLTAWTLRRRGRNMIDRWDEPTSTYRRVIDLDGRPTELVVRQAGSAMQPRLIVHVTPPAHDALERRRVRAIVDRLLGTRVDLSGWYRLAARDPRLRSLAEKFRGVKPPRFPTIVETLVNAFACQQLSLEVGLELLNRLAMARGPEVGTKDGKRFGFPDTRAMAEWPIARYRTRGFSRQKARAIVELARAMSPNDHELAMNRPEDDVEDEEDEEDEECLERLDREPDEAVCQRLLALRGVGRWTAEYVLLRGFGRLHVFPGDDVGARKKLARWLGRSHPLDYRGVQRAVERWHPYAGMVYFHLLLDGLSERGVLDARSLEKVRPMEKTRNTMLFRR